MVYRETKVYFDGSHYIGIPHTTRPNQKRCVRIEEAVEVKEDNDEKTKNNDSKVTEIEKIEEQIDDSTPSNSGDVPFVQDNFEEINDIEDVFGAKDSEPPKKQPRFATRKEIFNEWYQKSMELPRAQRKDFLVSKMRPYFKTEEQTEEFVKAHIQRKLRNLICRRIRLSRKANLQEFNYFCTFTYDNKIHDEESFKKKLRTVFRHYCHRRGWKYIGVWERSPVNKRLHFHGVFYIPEGTMPEALVEKTDYNFRTHKRERIHQNTYFLRRFGRNDFDPIDNKNRMGEALAYLMKYIEKSGEKIVYSKGLPQYFISDILEDDVITFLGEEEFKLVLFDDFTCWDEGCYVGVVSPDVIKQMRKVN